jgi:Flp pilus assembly protein TadD
MAAHITFRRAAAFFVIVAGTISTASSDAQDFTRGNGLVNESASAIDREQFREGVNLAEQALRSGEVVLDSMPALYNNLCIGLTGLRRFDEAIAACDKALGMSPREWAFYNNRANIFFYLGQFDKALAEYYKALTFNPAGGVLMNNISLTLEYRKTRTNTGAQEKSS